jgi:SAM-dependent methyltransferase
MELPSIDVIIPISRAWILPYLRNCLPSISWQDYPRELVSIFLSHVRDDPEEDMSELLELAQEHRATVVCSHPEDPSFNICKAYNVAARKGLGEVVALLDADVVFAPTMLQHAVRVLHSGKAAIVPVMRSDKRPHDELFQKTLPACMTEAEWKQVINPPEVQRDANGNIVISRAVFEYAHGYDERFYGWGAADHDLYLRINQLIGSVHMMDTECPKSVHQIHQVRPDAESDFTKRNRRLMIETKSLVRNEDGWGRIKKTSVLPPFTPPKEKSDKLIKFPVYDRTFAATLAQHADQTYSEIDRVLAAHKVERIVELGSLNGALSMYLALYGRRMGIPVYTIDINPLPDAETYQVLEDLGATVLRMNCLNELGQQGLRSLIGDAPVYLFCDNGNKPAEFAACVPSLMPGSAVSVHDWMYEIGPKHTDKVVAANGLTPFREEVWIENNLRMATWTVPNRGQKPVTELEASTTWRKGSEQTWHQDTVGGAWHAMGNAQLGLLKLHGLQSGSKLLDVGCGALRLGVKAIDFLDPGCYFGIDCFRELLETGIEREVKPHAALMDKRPQFRVNSTFDLEPFGGVTFDMAMAQSVFTHLPPHAIELCIRNIMARMNPGGFFIATYNQSNEGWAEFGRPYPHMTKYPLRLFASIARREGVAMEDIGAWGIEQNNRKEQLALAFRRT